VGPNTQIKVQGGVSDRKKGGQKIRQRTTHGHLRRFGCPVGATATRGKRGAHQGCEEESRVRNRWGRVPGGEDIEHRTSSTAPALNPEP
jgi:hypothetical protein